MTRVTPFDNQHPVRSPGADAAPTSARAPLESTAGHHLWHVGWVLVALLSVIVYVVGVPLYYDHVRALSSTDIDAPSTRAGLAHLGLSTNAYALALVTVEVVFTAVFVAVACLIVVRKPNDPFVAAISLSLIAFGTTFPRVDYALIDAYPQLTLPISLLLGIGFVCFFVCFYVFPDGRFVPSWTRALVPLWIIMEAGHFLLDQSSIMGWANNALFVVLVASAVYAQIHRYRHVSEPVKRQQTKWVVMGFAVAVVGFAGYGLTKLLIEPGAETVAHELIAGPLMVAALLSLPVSIGFAVLRHRLWDVDIIVNRALVYAALTLSVVGIYVLVVGYLGAILHSDGNLIISLVATGIVAVLFETMHGWFKRQVNRLMYGARDDPYDVITQLGQRLETTTSVEAVLPTVVGTIAQALKLPYAAISVTLDSGLVAGSSFGTPTGDILRIPLVHQSEAVGRLDLAPRAPGEAFSPADWRLLNGIASQAGVAAHAVRLSADLQRSRERLVTAREEERRRIRRDLHDGLGPALGGISLKLEAAQNMLAHDPSVSNALIEELKTQTQNAIADVRRVVYNLRPPALDELGLVQSLQQAADQHSLIAGQSGLIVTLNAPEGLPPLPAAVEVAAYRIVSEALNNVARHARATSALVRLSLEDALTIEIIDDGIGLPDELQPGIGLYSMRERAAELGGTCSIASRQPGGTAVTARLPLQLAGIEDH